MKCVVCRSGEVQLGKTTLTFEREGHTVVIREVPAQICKQCVESYTDQSIVV